MRAFVACLTVAALASPAVSDRFRTVLVGGNTDWASAGGEQGCDICSGGVHEGHNHLGGGQHSSSTHSSRYSSSVGSEPRYGRFGERGGGVGRTGGHRRTYHYSSEESEYTFSNGTHSTTITSKRSSEGVPEFHLKMTQLRDGAVIESTVLSEVEYRQRRASLGLSGSDGSFGFESLGGAGDIHNLSGRRLSGKDLLADLERRMGQRRGGHSRHSTTSFSSEESHYSFSNGTHTTSITGRRNSDGVREYGLELIRDSDSAVLDRATISEAEYNRRRQSMTGGEGFNNVFDIHGIHGSGTRSGSRHGARSDSRTRSRSEFESSSGESEFGSRSRDHRPVLTSPSGSSGSSSTYFRKESTETRRQEGSEACSCAPRSRCEPSDRVISAEALLRCGAGEVCCRNPGQDRRPLLPRPQTEEPRPSRPAGDRRPAEPRRPVAEPQVSEPSCSCVQRDYCTYRDRDFSFAGLQKCRHPMVCCRRQRLAPADDRAPLIPTPTSGARPAPRRTNPDPSLVQREREMFRDIVQHVDTDQAAPVPQPLDSNALQSSLSRFDDAHDIPGGHRRTEVTRSQHSLTETTGSRGRPRYDEPLQTVDNGEKTSSSTRRYSYNSNSRSNTGAEHRGRRTEDFNTQRPVNAGDGGVSQTSRRTYSYDRTNSGSTGTDADLLTGGGRRRYAATRSQQRQGGSDEGDSSEQSGTRVISSSRRYSERRIVSGEDSDEDERPYLDSGRRSRYDASRRTEQHSGQEPVDLPGPELGSSSSRRYSYHRSSSSSSTDLPETDRLLGVDGAGQRRRLGADGAGQRRRLGADGAGQHQLLGVDGAGQRRIDTSLHGRTDEYGQPAVASSSRRYSVERTVSGNGGGLHAGGGLHTDSGSDLGLSGGADLSHGGSSGGAVSSSSRRYSSQRVVSGDAGGADLGLGTDLGLGAAQLGGHSSGSKYSSSSSWSSRSERGSAGGYAPGSSSSYQLSPSGSGSSNRYSSHSSQQVPVSSSSYWSSYSQQSQRRKRGWFGGGDETPTTYADTTVQDNCVCVRFDRCSDGNLLYHGADLLDFSIGSRKQCSGFRVCCHTPPAVLSQLQTTPGLRPGVISSISTAGLQQTSSRVSSVAPHGTGERPCVCVSSYICQGGEIRASQQLLVDMRQVSQTGRCNYEGQVCCAVPWAQVATTPPPPPCTCVSGAQCSQQDILTRYTNANAPTCPGTQVCCSRPRPAPGGYGTPAVQPASSQEYDMYLFCKSYQLSVACSSTNRFNFLPTIQPSRYFDARADARTLKNAFGWTGVDDDVLIKVLTRRTFQERAQIKQAFKVETGSDLKSKIKTWTTGKFEDLMVELLEGSSMEEYLAKKLHEGMDGIGTDEDVVLETLISSTNDEIAAIKRYFQAESRHTLEDDIKDDFSGDLEDILVALANGTRDNSLRVDRQRAKQQAEALRSAGRGIGTTEDTFKYYLTHENYAQLALIFSEYEQLTGKPFEDALESEFSRQTEDAVLAIVEVTKNLPAYFAGRLHDALWGRGPISKDDSALQRILVSRAERDLGSIAQEYARAYGRTLKDDIEKKSTFDYENALVSLLGGTS